jgi:hypothetical protein
MRRLDKLLVRVMLQWKRLLARAHWFQVDACDLHVVDTGMYGCLSIRLLRKYPSRSQQVILRMSLHEQHAAMCRVRNHVSTSYVRSSFLAWAQVFVQCL